MLFYDSINKGIFSECDGVLFWLFYPDKPHRSPHTVMSTLKSTHIYQLDTCHSNIFQFQTTVHDPCIIQWIKTVHSLVTPILPLRLTLHLLCHLDYDACCCLYIPLPVRS